VLAAGLLYCRQSEIHDVIASSVSTHNIVYGVDAAKERVIANHRREAPNALLGVWGPRKMESQAISKPVSFIAPKDQAGAYGANEN